MAGRASRGPTGPGRGRATGCTRDRRRAVCASCPRIAPGGAITVLARIPLLDDLAFDRDGSLGARRRAGA